MTNDSTSTDNYLDINSNVNISSNFIEINTTANTTWGADNISTYQIVVNVTRGKTFWYRFYANNSAGIWNKTDMFNFTINDTEPVINRWNISNATWQVNGTDTSDKNITLFENATYTFNITNATDVDLDTIGYSWWLDGVVQAYTQAWNWVVGFFKGGVHNVTVVVNDTTGAQSQMYFNVTVKETDQPLTFATNITNASATTPKYNQNIQINLTLTDSDNISGFIFNSNITGAWANDSFRSLSNASSYVVCSCLAG